MPVLANARYERFAQIVADGKLTPTGAYREELPWEAFRGRRHPRRPQGQRWREMANVASKQAGPRPSGVDEETALAAFALVLVGVNRLPILWQTWAVY
jgi:hypothetical protein